MIAGVLLMVIGAIVVLMGVGILFLGLAAGPLLDAFDPTFPGTEFLTAVGLSVVVVGILEIAASIGVFEHRGWARWVGVILAVIGLIFGFFALLGSISDLNVDGASLVISILWVAANGFIVAALAAGWDHFERY
jgi:hypothetical protein